MEKRYNMMNVEGVAVVMPSESAMNEIKEASEGRGFRGFSLEELDAAFQLIQNPHNWKEKLFGYIRQSDFPKFQAAAEWYAGSPLNIAEYMPNGWVSVSGSGYYANIGS